MLALEDGRRDGGLVMEKRERRDSGFAMEKMVRRWFWTGTGEEGRWFRNGRGEEWRCI